MAGDGIGLDAHYRQVSPQLLARVRLLWAARGLDLDALWRRTVRDSPGFAALPPEAAPVDSRPVDLLLLFDQGAIWVQCLRAATGYALERGAVGAAGDGGLSVEQVQSLSAVLARLRQEMAGVRVLALAGLATPALQVARSLSEDVDTALLMLLSRKAARRFAACRSPQEAGAFWRRHVAGGRAFRTVTEELYRIGLDYGQDGSYARWRQEVLLLLGAAAHSSYPGAAAGRHAPPPAGLDPQAQECLHFAALRVQEMCVYSLVLGRALHEQLAAWLARAEAEGDVAAGPVLPLLRGAARGGEIIVEQMRWLISAGDPPR